MSMGSEGRTSQDTGIIVEVITGRVAQRVILILTGIAAIVMMFFGFFGVRQFDELREVVRQMAQDQVEQTIRSEITQMVGEKIDSLRTTIEADIATIKKDYKIAIDSLRIEIQEQLPLIELPDQRPDSDEQIDNIQTDKYIIIVRSSRDREWADRFITGIRERIGKAIPEEILTSMRICPPISGSGNTLFAVAIGDNLTHGEAEKMRTVARRIGFPSDSYIVSANTKRVDCRSTRQ
jgi:hypothetical protein